MEKSPGQIIADEKREEEALLAEARDLREKIREATEAKNRLEGASSGHAIPTPSPATVPASPVARTIAPVTPATPTIPATPVAPSVPAGPVAVTALENFNKTRDIFFAEKNKKRKTGPTMLALENAYKEAKIQRARELVQNGQEVEAREFLLKEVELKRKNDFETGNVTGKEKLMSRLSSGVEWWDNLGKEKGLKGYAQRFAKTNLSLVMIGATSGFSMQGLAKMTNAVSTSALGEGVTSYLGKKLMMSSAMSAVMAAIPEKHKKWAQPVLMASLTAGSLGAAAVAGGSIFSLGTAGIVFSSGIGLLAGQITKKYGKNIEENKKKVLSGKIDLATFESDLQRMEGEIEQALKDAESARVFGKIREGAIAVGASMLSLEVMGHIQDDRVAGEQHTADLKQKAELEAQHKAEIEKLKADIETALNKDTPAQVDTAQSNTIQTNTPDATPKFHETSVTFNDGKGGIQGILDLKTQMRAEYHNDFSHAPKSVQDFMHETNVTKQAQELGFFNPNDKSGAESAMILKDATLKFDEHGNLAFNNAQGQENILIHGDKNTFEKYAGKMFDSDKSADTPVVEKTATTPSAPEPKPEMYYTGKEYNPDMEHDALVVPVPEPTHQDYNKELHYIEKDENPINLSEEDNANGRYFTEEHALHEAPSTEPIHDITSKIAGNPFKLSPEGLETSDKLYTDFVYKFFPNKNNYDAIKNDGVYHALNVKSGAFFETPDSITSYIRKLYEITDLKPRYGRFFGHRDTIEEYIARAIQHATLKGGDMLADVIKIGKKE